MRPSWDIRKIVCLYYNINSQSLQVLNKNKTVLKEYSFFHCMIKREYNRCNHYNKRLIYAVFSIVLTSTPMANFFHMHLYVFRSHTCLNACTFITLRHGHKDNGCGYQMSVYDHLRYYFTK